MRQLSRLLFIALLFGLGINGCSCDDDPAAGTSDTGVVDTGTGPADGDVTDGSDNDGGSTDGETEDGAADNDGAVTNDGSVGDGGTADSGDPLQQPLSEFCRGEGTVVVVGGGGECAGEIAEETFQFGVCACESITVQSTLDIDAFDSSLGTYGSTLAGGGVNILEDGHLGINGELVMSGKLTALGSVYVGGGGFSVGSSSLVSKNVYAAGNATQTQSRTDIGRNAYFNGDVIGRYNITGDLQVPVGASVSQSTMNNLAGSLINAPVPNMRPCPCESDEILDIPGLTSWAATHNDNDVTNVITSTTWESGTGPNDITLPCGRYYITEINHPGPLNIRAEDRTVLFVDGDMTIGGSLNLTIDPGAEIDLFIAGNLNVQAHATFGDPNYPSKVRTYIGGTQAIEFNAAVVFGGNLYAPRADVSFHASANLYGALFAKNVDFNGSGNVHFDSAVRTAGTECEEPPPPVDAGVPDLGFNDAGDPIDAGSFPDATPVPDAGEVDSGTEPDAGTPDTGPTGCNGPCECVAPLGCVGGVCGACVNDLDCCPPLSCITGQCRIQL